MFFIKYKNGITMTKEVIAKTSTCIAMIIMEKYNIKKMQALRINFEGEKITPNVFNPASLSPRISFKSLRNTTANPKHKNINEIINPLMNESEKISQRLIVYEGYAKP